MKLDEVEGRFDFLQFHEKGIYFFFSFAYEKGFKKGFKILTYSFKTYFCRFLYVPLAESFINGDKLRNYVYNA